MGSGLTKRKPRRYKGNVHLYLVVRVMEVILNPARRGFHWERERVEILDWILD